MVDLSIDMGASTIYLAMFNFFSIFNGWKSPFISYVSLPEGNQSTIPKIPPR